MQLRHHTHLYYSIGFAKENLSQWALCPLRQVSFIHLMYSKWYIVGFIIKIYQIYGGMNVWKIKM